MVLASSAAVELPRSKGVDRWRGLIRVSVRDGSVAAVIASVGLFTRHVDRRPSLAAPGDEYFLEVEAEDGCGEREWADRVCAASGRVAGSVLGVWV